MTVPSVSTQGRTWIAVCRLVFVSACAVTLTSAFVPPADAPHLFPWDKAEHFLAFYILSYIACAAFPRLRPGPIILGMLLLGGVIEIVQGTPWIGRDRDFWDWVADATGVAFALAPLALAQWRRRMSDGAA